MTERMLASGNLIRVCGCGRIQIWHPSDPRPVCRCDVPSVPPPPPFETRRCSRCRDTKPLAAFLNGSGSLRHYCDECNRAAATDAYRRKHLPKPKREPKAKRPRYVPPRLEQKECPRCHETKPRSEFVMGVDRVVPFCHPCRREAAREYWRLKHPPRPKTEPIEASTRTCSTCSTEQANGEFYRRADSAGGGFRKICRSCHNARSNENKRNRTSKRPRVSLSRPRGLPGLPVAPAGRTQPDRPASSLPREAPAPATRHGHPFVHHPPRPPEPKRLAPVEPPAGSGLGTAWPCSHTMDMGNSRCVRCCLLKPQHYVLRRAAGGSSAAMRWLCDPCLAAYIELGLVDRPRRLHLVESSALKLDLVESA